MPSTASRPMPGALRFAPFVVIPLALLAMRTPLASAHPLLALLGLLWLAADTLTLALLARSKGRPQVHRVLAAFAAACLVVALGAPAPFREVLRQTQPLTAAMAGVIAAHLAWGGWRAARVLRKGEFERQDRWIEAAAQVLPRPLVRLAAAEVRLLHMALFRWVGPADVPADARAFAYHKHLAPICTTLLILGVIEVAAYHLLLAHWSRTASLVLFVLSDLGFVYVVGLIKSLRYRPVLLTREGVRVRAGFAIDQFVPFEAIAGVTLTISGEEVRAPETLNAALLAWPNVLIRLNAPLERRKGPPWRRSRRPITAIALRLDDPEPFVHLLVWRLGQRAN